MEEQSRWKLQRPWQCTCYDTVPVSSTKKKHFCNNLFTAILSGEGQLIFPSPDWSDGTAAAPTGNQDRKGKDTDFGFSSVAGTDSCSIHCVYHPYFNHTAHAPINGTVDKYVWHDVTTRNGFKLCNLIPVKLVHSSFSSPLVGIVSLLLLLFLHHPHLLLLLLLSVRSFHFFPL